MHSEGDLVGVSDNDAPSLDGNLKRKREDIDDAPKKPKMKRRKSVKISKYDQDDDINLEKGINERFGQMDAQLIADHLARQAKRFEPELSMIELEEKRIPTSTIRDTFTWQKTRDLEHLPDFVKHFSSVGRKTPLSTAPKANGSPHTIVVTAAGLRAANLTRSLRVFESKQAVVAKLFAKHIKLAEAVKYVKKSRINIGVGTPSRIIDLLDNGALSSAHLERIILDISHVDTKKRGIVDMKETLQPLLALLNRAEIRQRFEDGANPLDLLFY